MYAITYAASYLLYYAIVFHRIRNQKAKAKLLVGYPVFLILLWRLVDYQMIQKLFSKDFEINAASKWKLYGTFNWKMGLSLRSPIN